MIPFSYPSPRVSQLDAHILDTELFSLLKDQLASVSQLHASRWSFSQNPEVWSLILQLVIFRLTTSRNGTSYGLALQNLRYTGGRKNLLLASIIGGFIYEKLSSYLYLIDENVQPQDLKIFKFFKEKKSVILSKIDHTLKLLNLVNFTLFLVDGRYSSLEHRILGISLTPIVSDLLKFNGNSVNFEFQNRQLVWNVMTEFLVFTLPLLQLGKLRKAVQKAIKPKKEVIGNTQFTNLPISECAICHDNNFHIAMNGGGSGHTSGSVTNPYVTNCGHVYCYVCISTRFNSIKSNGDTNCLRCNTKLLWFKEYEDIDLGAVLFEGEEVEEEAVLEKEEVDEEEVSSDDYSEQEEYDEDEAFGM